jgi:hypothetical protein
VTRLPLRTALRIAPEELRTRSKAKLLTALRRAPFELDGEEYRYLVHHYNRTWDNERTVEVPIAAALVRQRPNANMLELGNVLHNYLPSAELSPGRTVVDKYEATAGVSNVDVLDHRPDRPYDLIVALSTIEHVGRDEEPQDPLKASRALECLHGWLAPGGELLVTVPLGYHPELDRRLLDGPPMFQRLTFMRRISADNRWEQVEAEDVRGSRFDSPYPSANALAIGRSSA